MTEYIVLTKDELVEIIENTVQRTLMEQRADGLVDNIDANTNWDKWLSVEDLMDYIPSHPSKQTIYRWTMSKYIPHHKRGKSLQFKKSEIDQWLDDAKRKTTDEIREEARLHNRRSA